MLDDKKKEKLIKVARLYYEEDKNQVEIANIIGVSRPMVSKLLAEAKSVGIVTITINELKNPRELLVDDLMNRFGLNEVILLDSGDDGDGRCSLSDAVVKLLPSETVFNLGIGCGSTLGRISDALEAQDPLELNGEICPLIGGFKATFKSYHTNELVRSISQSTGLSANYMYFPAMFSSRDEKLLYMGSDQYKEILELWENLDIALLNISPLYAPPDLATSARFGKRLITQKAVGRFLAHYYDINGKFISAIEDNVMQAETEVLEKIDELVAICSNTVDAKSVIGALNTKMFTKVIMREGLAHNIIIAIEGELRM